MLQAREAQGIAFLPYAPIIIRHSRTGQALDAIAKSHNALPQQVALQWLLRRSPVMLPIPGTSQATHAHENVDAAWVEPTSDDLARLDASV